MFSVTPSFSPHMDSNKALSFPWSAVCLSNECDGSSCTWFLSSGRCCPQPSARSLTWRVTTYFLKSYLPPLAILWFSVIGWSSAVSNYAVAWMEEYHCSKFNFNESLWTEKLGGKKMNSKTKMKPKEVWFKTKAMLAACRIFFWHC